MATYDIGDVVKLYTSTPFTSAINNQPFDPDTVNFLVMDPNGTVTQYIHGTDPEVIKVGTGDYYMYLRPTINGTWKWRVEGFTSGLAMGAEEASFSVKAQVVDI